MKSLLLISLFALTAQAVPSSRAHEVNVRALTLALDADRASRGGIDTLPDTMQRSVDETTKEALELLRDETLPLSVRLTALAALERVGAYTTSMPLTTAEVENIRHPQLKAMAGVVLEHLDGHRRAMAHLKR